jgi:plastocyanin
MNVSKILIVLLLTGITVFPVAAQSNSGSKDPKSVTIDLVAKNIAFDKSTITVPAGAEVTINFDNRDSGIPHNFAVYESSAAKKVVFKGKIITGAKKITYTFTAPAQAGDYFFRCDVHPTIMTGTFTVQ